jgi:ketosteroid isomerase-like protein
MPASPPPRPSRQNISARETSDRIAIRELVDTYARCADGRDAEAQMSLFTEDTHFVMRDAKNPLPTQEIHSRNALAPVFADLKQYHVVMHFNGQSTIHTLADESATGETYCLAHLVSVTSEGRRLTVISVRYLDAFRKIDDRWFFAERIACVDWVDDRAIA